MGPVRISLSKPYSDHPGGRPREINPSPSSTSFGYLPHDPILIYILAVTKVNHLLRYLGPKWSLILPSSLSSMPREASVKADFRKSHKSAIGSSVNHFRPAGRWAKDSGTSTTGKHTGQRQREWQDEVNSQSQVLLDSTCCCIYLSHYLIIEQRSFNFKQTYTRRYPAEATSTG